MNRKVEIMFDKENRQREAKRRLKEKQLALLNGSKKMVVVGATTLVLAGAFSCSQASAYDRYDDNSYRGLGYMCFSDEVGSDGDGSYVSPGTGDYGGISYGLYQFSTTTGSAKDFVNWSKDNNYPEIYKIFQDAGNPKAGTPAFGKAWKKCYKELEGKFEEAQTEFAMGELINPGYEKVKDEIGIDLKKSRARTEFLISTANQFGRGGIVTLFKEVQNKGIKLSDDMSDTELLGIMCQHKYDTVDYHFRSSSAKVQHSARLRFKREKKELLKIAKEEEGPKLDEIDTNKEQTEATKTETSSSKTSKKEVVNDTADKYQGKGITYDFGEKNYKSGSLDCSGLISQMMNDMGVKVDAGNTNALKFSNDSKKISKDEVQPGDLVFWNDDNGSRHNSVYHIGMYVGNDTIVDCSPSHNGVGTRKLSECKDTGDMHYTYGRYTKLEDKMKDYAQKIVESIDEFDDVITVDNSDIEKEYKKVEEKANEVKEAINENAKEDKSEETSKEDTTDNKEDNNVQEENKKDNETSLDKSEDASNKDEFESIIDEDKADESKDTEKDKAETEDKTEESKEESKEESNDSTLDKTLVVGDSHAKALEDKLKDNKDTEVEATVGASAYVYLNDTNYFGDKLIDKLPKDSDKINKVIISLGVNNIEGNSNINDVKKVIDKIESMYPGKDIYFMKVNHVGDKYKDGDVDKTNKMIDDLNKEIENYVKDKDKVKVIDASKGLETEGKLTETSDGLHVKDNDKLINNLEKGIEENKKDNETSLDKSEDASNKDEFESIIDEGKVNESKDVEKDKTETEDKTEESKEDKEESNEKQDSTTETSKEDKSEAQEEQVENNKESKEKSSKEKEPVVEEQKESSNKESNQKEESKEESNEKQDSTTETSKEDKSEAQEKEPVVEEYKEESSNKESNQKEESNDKQDSTIETSKEDKSEAQEKEPVVEESKEESNDKQESTAETSKEDKSEVKETVQNESTKSSKEKEPVVEEQKEYKEESSNKESNQKETINDKQESTTETSSTKEDKSEAQEENSKVDELHSRLQNNLFGRILMG